MLDEINASISAHSAMRFTMTLLRRFVSQCAGATAVEFGLVAAPFIALVFATLQTGIIFLAGQTLETATAKAARLVMTGQAQTQGWSAAQFKQQVCNSITGLFNCQSGIYVDVKTYSSFAAVNPAVPITNGSFNSSGLGYDPGGPGDIVVVHLYYQYPVYINLFGFNPSNLNGGFQLLGATAVFKNEPYVAS